MAFTPQEAALPGATIAQQAAAKAGTAAAAAGRSGPPKKVATSLGEQKFKAPIGALIVPHPKHAEPPGLKEHFIKGAPSHFDEGMSQATWVANQWKDHGKADRAFHKGLREGTHRLVQAGSHEFAVHKDIDVHVPKQTDLHNPEAVKNAPKMFTKKNEKGEPAEHLVFNPNHPSGSKPMEASGATEGAKEHFWKPLHRAEHKKSVSFEGKHAAYVPDDWRVYKVPGTPESTLIGKFAQDPDGGWHSVKKDGSVTDKAEMSATLNGWVRHKVIVLDEAATHEHPALPEPEHKGPASPVVGIPGKDGEPVTVTKQDIHTALAILAEDKSTAVKQPLAKKGHPLAAMDYHAVAQAELAKHPELKVSPGTKKEHVGQVKLAVIHHLSGRLAHLAKTEAEAGALQAAQDQAQAEAQHAQLLTPHTFDIGGVSATREQVADAIALLEEKKSTSIKQPLKHAGNVLGDTDYWAVIHAYEDAHPSTKDLPQGKGTKTEHFGYAKTVFIKALQEKAGLLAKADQATGHAAAAAAYAMALDQPLKDGWEKVTDGALAAAAKLAVKYKQAYHAFYSHAGEAYTITPHEPQGGNYFTVTPQLAAVTSSGADLSSTVPKALKDWTVPQPPAGDAALKPPAGALKQLPEPTPQAKEALAALKEALNKPPEQPPPELAGVPALDKNGVYAGEYPPGSVLYVKKGYSGEETYAKAPDGQFYYVASSSGYSGMPVTSKVEPAPSYYVDESQVANGTLKPKEPPAAEQVKLGKQVADAKAQIQNGAMAPSAQVFAGEPVFPSWEKAAAYALSTGHKGGGSVSIVPTDGGFRYSYVGSDEEHHSVEPSNLEVRYYPPGKFTYNTKPEPDKALQQLLLQEVHASVVPGSVVIDGKLHQFGYYKNPKGSTYILVKPAAYPEYWKYGTAAYAAYVYSDSNGKLKDVTPAFAAKQLAKATEFSSTPPVKEVKSLVKVSFAPVYAPGPHKLWENEEAGVGASTVEVKADGSGLVKTGSGYSFAVDELSLSQLLKGGTLLDQYGTTVVKPGQPADKYHIWGSPAKTPEQVKNMLDWLDSNPQEAAWPKVFQSFLGNWSEAKGNAIAFLTAHQVAGGDAQRAAVTALLAELLAVPKLPEDAKLGAPGKAKPEGPVFLKEMPPGVTSAKDVFTYTPAGNVVPFQGAFPQYPSSLTVPELKGNIKAVSQEFGGGQVVGLHLSGLSAADLASWLDAWKKGDMAQVFELDAKGGKVSPAHPGAPDNPGTHQVTWSAKDPGQVPASQDIPGAWSDLATVDTLPPLEVNNYLVKMGFQHAEFLAAYEKQQVVRAHRQHNQQMVDTLTGLANERLAQGAPPKTEAPVWTDGLKPAKAYDQAVKDSLPADEWSIKALKAFAQDNAAVLLPYLDQVASEHGFVEGGQYFIDNTYWSYVILAVQKWLDEAHAKEVAAQMVPVWKKVPADIKESHGHEVLKATKTIPYTGEVTTYFVKPAPGGETFRLEQEHAANLLGRLFGFQSAESLLLNEKALAPGLVQAQKAVPGAALGHYTDMPPWSAFTDQQVADIAAEHLLDHVLSNDDSSANNMIKTPSGRIVGIDKGRSWGDMGWDSLSGTSSMDSMTQLVYTKLYNGIRSHQVTKDQADKAFLAVIARARKMQAVSDKAVQGILDAGFAHRAKFGSFGSRQGLIDEVLRRKNNLEPDFAKLWGRVYKDAGIGPLPEVPEQKLPDAHGSPLHAGFSDPALLEHVTAGKSHGVPVFFGGYELADMHFLLHQEQREGKTVTQGEGFLRGKAYDKVVAFLKKHAQGEDAPANDTKTSYGADSNGPLYPPYNSADRGGIDGERGFFADIIGAARTITKHAADGQYNQAKMDALETTRNKLIGMQDGFGAAVAANPDSTEPDIAQAKNGLDMAEHYLGLIAKLDAAKAGSYGLGEFDLLRWLPKEQPKPAAETQDELAAMGIKLHVRQGDAYHNAVLDEAGNKVTSASTHQDAGKYWVMTLPAGEEIRIGDGQDMGVQVAQWGRVRFTTAEHSAVSLENVRAALQLAGMELPDAEPYHFEQFYWRHMLATMADRKDSSKQPVWPALQQQFADLGLTWPGTVSYEAGSHRKVIDQLATLAPEQEAQVYRTAFAALTSPGQVQEFADKGGFFPVQKHFDPRAPQVAGGKPDWYRFDLLAHADKMPMPSRHGTGGDYGANVVKNGGSYGTDALHRVAGEFTSGMGNPASSGGPRYVFTGLNLTSSRSLVFTPLTAMRSHNYSYTDDSFGNIVSSSKGGYSGYPARHEAAYWDHKVWGKYSGSSNETMISDALSFLDDVELVVDNNPQQVIKWLKDHGITHIRHMPVEDRVVSHIGAAEFAKVKANLAAHPELLDPFAVEQHGLPGAAEPGAPAVAAEAKAEVAALDTAPAAKAAEAGSPPPAPGDLSQVLGYYTPEVQQNAIKGIYRPIGNKDIYYVQFKNGSWGELDKNPGGGLDGPFTHAEGSYFAGNLSSAAGSASLPKVWEPSAAGLNVPVDQLLANVMTASLGPGWMAASDGKLFYGPGHIIVKMFDGFDVYKGDNIATAKSLGTFATLEQAKAAVTGAP